MVHPRRKSSIHVSKYMCVRGQVNCFLQVPDRFDLAEGSHQCRFTASTNDPRRHTSLGKYHALVVNDESLCNLLGIHPYSRHEDTEHSGVRAMGCVYGFLP